jgi:hypothetical protein
MRSFALTGMACLLLGGCLFQNASAATKLRESLAEMNKATRWGQLGLAAQMVVPLYREQFIKNHAHWGKTVQLADSEIVHVQMAKGDEDAVAMIAYEWYQTESMTLHQSVVRQRWSRTGDGYALLSEVVVQGDGRLLAPSAHDSPGKPAMMADPLLGRAD